MSKTVKAYQVTIGVTNEVAEIFNKAFHEHADDCSYMREDDIAMFTFIDKADADALMEVFNKIPSLTAVCVESLVTFFDN